MLRLQRVFGSPQAVLSASIESLEARGKLSRRQAQRLRETGGSLDRLRAQVAAWQADGISLVSMEDADYPDGLGDLSAMPPILYVRGTLAPADARAVAIVGTRRPDEEGLRLARLMGRELAQRGFTNVSGLARGIDAAGHRGALSVEEGRTIAVLGCGLLRVYPPENAELAREISARGCVVAEVPPETKVARHLLLARDRLQAAMSRAVVVIQAHESCGSIVTAGHAVRHGRLLYAVPWSEPPFLDGWRRLKAMGASPLAGGDIDFDALAAEIDAGRAESAQQKLV
jgi:DNA processing protein